MQIKFFTGPGRSAMRSAIFFEGPPYLAFLLMSLCQKISIAYTYETRGRVIVKSARANYANCKQIITWVIRSKSEVGPRSTLWCRAETEQRPSRGREIGFGCQVLRVLLAAAVRHPARYNDDTRMSSWEDSRSNRRSFTIFATYFYILYNFRYMW